MSQSNVEFNTDQASTATNRLEVATDDVQGAVSEYETLTYSQTENKWGVAEGPSVFRERYAQCLRADADEMERLKHQLDAFIAQVRSAIRTFESNESDAEAAAQLKRSLIDDLAEQASQTPSTGGFEGADYDRDERVAGFINGLARPI